MKKICGAVLLSTLGFAVFPSQEVVYAAAGAAPAASRDDPVQHCLDLVQLNVAGKITPALPVTSHPVQSPPKNLPIQCLAGDLKEIKSALKNQIANCQRKSAEEKAQTFQFGCRMVKNEDYCLNANTEMLKIASQPNMDIEPQDCDRCLAGRFRTMPTVEFGTWTAPQPPPSRRQFGSV